MKLETFTIRTPVGFLILLGIGDPARCLAAAGRREPGIGMIGALKPELPLDQLKGYANPDGPLALLLSRK